MRNPIGRLFLVTVTLAMALLAIPAPSSPAATGATTVRTCPPADADRVTCFAVRRTDGLSEVQPAGAAVMPSGYGAADLRQAYALNADSSETVAIVDAYDDPNAEQDLAVYRSQYSLSACTTANGCFHKVNQRGAAAPIPSANANWAGEISLDLDMVSAICPHCRILLIEADDNTRSNMYAAEDYAAGHAYFVSNSWGTTEYAGERNDDWHFTHPGVAITASTGDNGFGTSYPAASPQVTSVGGTSLWRSSVGSRGWTETAWSGAGSGCSPYEPRPSRQDAVATGCGTRAIADVSAVADPATGVAVYQTYGAGGWSVYGGTSAAAPVIAAVYALAGQPGPTDAPVSYPYAYAPKLNDVTSGSNGTCGTPPCMAGQGWDGPTGLGTPANITALAATHLWQFGVANGAWYANNIAADSGANATGRPSVDWASAWVRGSDSHLRQFYLSNGTWVVFDVTAATGVAIAGNPTGQDGAVYARDTDNHLRQFYVSHGAWVAFDITAATGVPVLGDTTTQAGGAFARDTSNHLRQFYVSNGAWVAFDVTAATGSPVAGNPAAIAGGAYARDASNHLMPFYVSNGAWVAFDVTAATGSSIAGDPTPVDGGIYARDPAGHLTQLYVSNGTWVAFDVTAATGVPIAGNPTSLNGTQYARTAAGHLVQFYVSAGRWVSYDVTAATGAPVCGDPLIAGSVVWST